MQSWWQLWQNRSVQIGGSILVGLYLLCFGAEVLAPYDPFTIQSQGSLLPPTMIYWWSETGEWLGPHVYPTEKEPINLETGEQPLKVDRSHPAGIRLWVKGSSYRWLGIIPGDRHCFGTVSLRGEDPPAPLNILGTDEQGRDYFSRLLYGSRISLSVGILGIGVAFPLGILIGGISGYFGGWVDVVIMRCAEVLMSIPSLYLLVSLAAVLQINPLTKVPFSNPERFLIIIVLTSCVSWAGLARVIRGQVLSLRQQEYVLAAQVAGGGSLYLLVRHILPQTVTYTLISATLSIPSFIAAESVLSLIGLGIQQPDPSWGNMLSLATNASVMILQPWLIISPTLLIMTTSFAFNILGDGL
jgi:peptide/nickel transport system permease protein